jgi:hypothetical protein
VCNCPFTVLWRRADFLTIENSFSPDPFRPGIGPGVSTYSVVQISGATSVSGGAAAVANFMLLYCLTEFLHVWYIASSLAGLVTGFVTSFVLQKFWAF